MTKILEIKNLKKYFKKKSVFGTKIAITKAVDDVTFSLEEGEVFVLAGESGSGKSTIAKLILKSIQEDSGEIIFEGKKITDAPSSLNLIRMGCQMIHQDPYDSINPRMKIRDIVIEPLEIHNKGSKEDRINRVEEVLKEVKLEPAKEIMNKFPHMLSGGQRQRVVLARALAINPKIIIADEPVSMLDVSIRAEMLELMERLQKKFKISFIYITHDLATAKNFGQRIGILYLGKIVEIGEINKVLLEPKHPYTQALIDAISEPNPENRFKEKKIRIKEGEAQIMEGCNFRGRCPYAIDKCKTEPELEPRNDLQSVACFVKI